MSEDDVHYESCGESNVIETVNSVNTTNEVVTITNVHGESSCDDNDFFVSFDNVSERKLLMTQALMNNMMLKSQYHQIMRHYHLNVLCGMQRITSPELP